MVGESGKRFEYRSSQHFLQRPAVDALHRRIPDQVLQLVIDDDDAFRRVLDDHLEE